tara:strand:+ start:50 stop:184 length:135 start_codon:yes stop_codon:yes gene_type:complete
LCVILEKRKYELLNPILECGALVNYRKNEQAGKQNLIIASDRKA